LHADTETFFFHLTHSDYLMFWQTKQSTIFVSTFQNCF